MYRTIAVILAFVVAGSALTPDDVRTMPVNSWLSAPNTKIRPLDPCPGHNCVYTAVEGVKGVHSYSGAAFDTKRNRLIVWGGGHNAYYGNEIYVFDVDDMQWTRLTNPSTSISVSGYGSDPYPDGEPASRHTYNGLAYITHADKFFVLGGARAAQAGGCGANLTWTFDFAQNAWSNMQPSGPQPAPECDDLAAYDPIGKKVWWGEGHIIGGTSSWGLYSYDVDANQWTHVDPDNGYNRMIAIVDTKRRLLVIVGGDGYGGQYWVITYNLAAANVKASRQVWNTTGGSGFIDDYYMGFAYDPVADRYVGIDGGGTVYALNPDTKVWTSHTPSGTGPDQSHLAGIYGLWQYAPSVNAFIFQTNVDNDVHFYKFSAGGGTTAAESAERTGEGMSAFPNPFHSSVAIQVSGPGAEVLIFDAAGRRVARFGKVEKKVHWNPLGAPKGIYLVKARAAGRVLTRRVVLR